MAGHLWITYAWADNDEGDFNHLVEQLRQANINAQYDRISLVPGQQLWDQIADRIESPDLAAFSYLVTPKSIASKACKEELAYALNRALSKKESGFPLIGLIHGVPISEVPASLRTRLCIDLASPNWIEDVRAGLERRPPEVPPRNLQNFKVKFHNEYLRNQSWKSVEVVARFGEIRYWRFAYLGSGPTVSQFGIGPANGGAITGVLENMLEGSSEISGIPVKFVGAGNPISPSTAAYLVFDSKLSSQIWFGWSTEPYEAPKEWWCIKTN